LSEKVATKHQTHATQAQISQQQHIDRWFSTALTMQNWSMPTINFVTLGHCQWAD